MARRCNLCSKKFGCYPCLTDSIEDLRRTKQVEKEVKEHEQSHLPYIVDWQIFFEVIH